jgi:Tfp pilus assembly protein PilF
MPIPQSWKLDQNLAAAHAALGFTTFYWDRDFVRSRALFDRALELDPVSADNNHWLALTTMQTGAFDVALHAIRRPRNAIQTHGPSSPTRRSSCITPVKWRNPASY